MTRRRMMRRLGWFVRYKFQDFEIWFGEKLIDSPIAPVVLKVVDVFMYVNDKTAGIVAKFRTPGMVREVETELRKADVRRGLDEDLGIEGEGWIHEDTWADEDDWYFDGREWRFKDDDNPGNR